MEAQLALFNLLIDHHREHQKTKERELHAAFEGASCAVARERADDLLALSPR